MNREVLQNILLTVFGLALILGGYVVFAQYQVLNELSGRIDSASRSMMEASEKTDDAMMKLEEMEQEQMMRDEQARIQARGVTLAGLTFDLPNGWSVDSVSGNTAKIRVPDPNYNVIIPLSIRKLEGQVEAAPFTAEFRTGETEQGDSIYICASAPSLLCREVGMEENVYQIVFEVPESDEPVPENLDGVWFPSTIVTESEMEAVVRSVH